MGVISRGQTSFEVMSGQQNAGLSDGPRGSEYFPGTAQVFTPDGLVAVERLLPGSLVLTGAGEFAPVSSMRTSFSAEGGLVHLISRGVGMSLSVAPECRVRAIKAETKKCASVGAKWDKYQGGGDRPLWIPADYLSPGDYVGIPRLVGSACPISLDLAWAYGLYLAEGSALVEGGATKKHYRVCMTMHEREFEVLQHFADILSRELGMTAYRLYQRKRGAEGNSVTSEYVCSGKQAAIHFRELFGHGAKGKRLPSWMLGMSPELKRAMVKGWVDGDGHTAQKLGYTQTSATTISPVLAAQMFQMALGADLRPSASSVVAGGRRKSDSHTIHFNAGQESLEVEGELFYRLNARYRDRNPVQLYGVQCERSAMAVSWVNVLLS